MTILNVKFFPFTDQSNSNSQIRGNFSTQILKKWLSVGWNEKIHKKEISRVSEQSSWDFRLKEGKISSSLIV